MIISRYLNKEVLKTTSVVLMVLLLLFTGQRFVLYMNGAARGEFASELVLSLLLLQIPVFVSYLLPLSLFLGLLITLGKLHTDNEMTVIATAGISRSQILFYFAPQAILLSIITGYLTLFQVPSAIDAQQNLFKEQKKKGDFNLIRAGRFHQSSDGKRIIYVEEISDKKQLQRIFFVQQEVTHQDDFSLLVAENGRYWTDNNQKNFLVLENGFQYQGTPGNNQFKTLSFERYFMELKSALNEQTSSKSKARSTQQLYNNLTVQNHAELQWRIAAPISIPLLLLLALPLAQIPPRQQGKFARLIPGLMIYIGYMILLVTMRSAIEEGKVSPWYGTAWVHLLLLCYGYSKFTEWRWLKIVKSLVFRVDNKKSVH